MNNQFEEQLEKDLKETQEKISALVQEFDNKYYLKGYQLSIKILYDKKEMNLHKSRVLCGTNKMGNLNWM